MFSDDRCVNETCSEKDTEFHLFYSNCFSEKNQIVQPNTEYNDIYSSDVSKQKTIKDIIMSRYEKRMKFLSSQGRSN